MSRPSAYITVVRTLVGVLFLSGALIHLRTLVLDRESYAGFGATALPPLSFLWEAFVMPNIVWLALGLAAVEFLAGVAAWLPGRWNRLSVIGITVFFVFLVFLGYAFPTDSVLEDFFVNRAGSFVMIAAVFPWLLRPQQLSVPMAWAHLIRGPGLGSATPQRSTEQ